MKNALVNLLLLWMIPRRSYSTSEQSEPSEPIEDLDDTYQSDFERTLVESNDLFVDKTAFIIHATNRSGITDSILRGRRWGKTFNLHMLQTFFDIRHDENGTELPWTQRDIYFKGGKLRRKFQPETNHSEIITLDPLEVSNHPQVMEHMGQHPVIYLSFLDCDTSYDIFLNCIVKKISNIIKTKNYANFLTSHCNFITYEFEGIYGDKSQCKQLLRNPKKALKSKFILEHSLSVLVALLTEHFHREPVILIDEYDYPLHDMIYSKVDFDIVSQFIHNLFYYTFPIDRRNSFKGIVAGLLRVHVTETLFVNTIGGGTVLDHEFVSDFGFTKDEIESLLDKYPSNLTTGKIDQWYDGFYIYDKKMYNPYSVINCLLRGGTYRGFWITQDSSSNNEKLNHELKITSSLMLMDKHQNNLQKLYCQYKMTTGIAISTDFRYHMTNEELLSNLIFLGYLSALPIPPTKLNIKEYYKPYPNKYQISIPNKEIRDFFKTNIRTWALQKLHLQEEGRLCEDFNFPQSYEKETLSDMERYLTNDIFPKLNGFQANLCDAIFALLLTLEGPWILNRTFTAPGTDFLDCMIILSPDKSNKLDPLFIAVKYTETPRYKIDRNSWKKKFRRDAIPGLINAIPQIRNMRYGYPKELTTKSLHTLVTFISDPFINLPDTSKCFGLHSTASKTELTQVWRIFVEVYRIYRPEEGQKKRGCRFRKALGKLWPFRLRRKTSTTRFIEPSNDAQSQPSNCDESEQFNGV